MSAPQVRFSVLIQCMSGLPRLVGCAEFPLSDSGARKPRRSLIWLGAAFSKYEFGGSTVSSLRKGEGQTITIIGSIWGTFRNGESYPWCRESPPSLCCCGTRRPAFPSLGSSHRAASVLRALHADLLQTVLTVTWQPVPFPADVASHN